MGNRIEYKQIPFECKKITDEGDFEGYLATFDNIDLGNDMIHKGAFTKTLREKKKFPFLKQHDRWSPIGSFVGKEDDFGLFINGKLNLMTTATGVPKIIKAHESHALMLNGDILDLSMGYDAVKYDYDEDKKKGTVRHLREVRLWEGSHVTFAMDLGATVTDVKTMKIIHDIRKLIEQGELTKEQIMALFDNESIENITQILEPSILNTDSQSDDYYPKLNEALQKLLKEVKLL
jgi:hypothetical protein